MILDPGLSAAGLLLKTRPAGARRPGRARNDKKASELFLINSRLSKAQTIDGIGIQEIGQL